jgi:hypothetical protein
MYVPSHDGYLYEFNLETPGRVETAVFVQKRNMNSTNWPSVWISYDGHHLFYSNRTSLQYGTLETPFNILTYNYVRQRNNLEIIGSFWLNPEMTKLFIPNYLGNKIYSYNI